MGLLNGDRQLSDHRPPTTITLLAETAARQQQTADLFYENKLVPKKSTSVPASGNPQTARSEIMSLNMFCFYRPTVMVATD